MFKKGFISGFIVSTLVSVMLIASISYASNNSITALLADIKIFVNNKELVAKDANGQELSPILYNGSTYLPIRAISEAVNMPVEWEAKTKSVYLGKKNSTDADSSLQYLTHLGTAVQTNFFGGQYTADSADRYIEKSTDFTANDGTFYNNARVYRTEKHDGRYGVMIDDTYLLNMKYKKFKGTFALSEQTKNSTMESVLHIYGDDKLLHSVAYLGHGSLPMNFEVDVTNVITLKLQIVRFQGDSEAPILGIVNTELYE